MFSNKKLPEPLEKQEIEENFKKMKEGDITAKNEIIEHNLRLVTHIARKFNDPNYETEDLESIGAIGLIKSVNTFDLNKNIHFATYASRCIENEILMYLRHNNKRKNDISLSETVAQDNEGKQLKIEDIVEDSHQDFMSEYEQEEINELTRKIIETLPEEEKYITMEYFRFINDNKVTQKQLAEKLGISRSYVSRKIKKNLNKIAAELKKAGIVRGVNGGITVDISNQKGKPNSSKNKVLSKKRNEIT